MNKVEVEVEVEVEVDLQSSGSFFSLIVNKRFDARNIPELTNLNITSLPRLN